MPKKNSICHYIDHKIYIIRDKKVMLDRDLAELYGMETRLLKRAVNRNRKRFPIDFMFTLSEDEIELMVSQIGIPSKAYFGGAKPYAFTEHGILMLSSILNSQKAIDVNIAIMRIFIKFREMLSNNRKMSVKMDSMERKIEKHDKKIMSIISFVEQLAANNEKKEKKIGFLR